MAGTGARGGWEHLSKKQLLRVRICDLGLDLADTPVQPRIDKVLSELRARKLRLRPHFWLSDEWASPDGVPGVSVPFYLAHPRLMALERAQMQEVEGGTHGECLRLLRHEVGHAFEHAYRLNRRRRWRELFGPSSRRYPDHYRPNPRSKNYVLHLKGWYAQSHPSEDFAETFAVWLRPGSDWRRRYAEWPAKRKLELVDELMKSIAGKPPPVRRRVRPYTLPKLTITLGEFYEQKREHYPVDNTSEYDEDLAKLFSRSPRYRRRQTAADFFRRARKSLVDDVCRFAPDHGPVVGHVIDEMQARCRELGFRVKGRETALRRDLALVLTKHAVDFGRSTPLWWPV